MANLELDQALTVDPAPMTDPDDVAHDLIREFDGSSAQHEVGRPLAKSAKSNHSAKILTIDDEPFNIKVVHGYLAMAGYKNLVSTASATDALNLIELEQPDVIILDVMMPEVSGLEILAKIRSVSTTMLTPVLILTASTDRETKQKALDLGATDFLTKPVDSSELLLRVRNSLVVKTHQDHLQHYAEELEQQVRQRTAELSRSRLEVIHCLGRAAEFRDNQTGRHVVRVGRYAGVIARELGLDSAAIELIEHAAPLHDVGKIGIPDSILLKPGRLEPDEFKIMQVHCRYGKRIFERIPQHEWLIAQSHPEIGKEILMGISSPLLKMAATIALTHHERWDGGGYPLGLAGENIPMEGRITAVADVFDALSSERPYKPAFPLQKCFDILRKERERHFDPNVLDAFFAGSKEILNIQIECADVE